MVIIQSSHPVETVASGINQESTDSNQQNLEVLTIAKSQHPPRPALRPAWPAASGLGLRSQANGPGRGQAGLGSERAGHSCSSVVAVGKLGELGDVLCCCSGRWSKEAGWTPMGLGCQFQGCLPS